MLGGCHPTQEDELRAALRSWDLRRAEALLQRRIRGSPSPDSLYIQYVQVLIWQGKWHAAEQALEQLPRTSLRAYLTGIVAYHRGKGEVLSAVAGELIRAGGSWAGRGYFLLGRWAFYEGDYVRSDSLHREALRQAATALDSAHALRQLGVLAWYRGELDRAEALYRKALDAYERSHFLPGWLTVRSNLGLLAQSRGRLLEHLRVQLEVLEARQRIGDLTGMADSYYFLCNRAGYSMHMPVLCMELLEQSYRLARRHGYVWGARVARRTWLSTQQMMSYHRTRYRPPLLDTLQQTIPEGRWFVQIARWGRQMEDGILPPIEEVDSLYRELVRLPYTAIQASMIGFMHRYALRRGDRARWVRLPLERLDPLRQQLVRAQAQLVLDHQPRAAYIQFQQLTRQLDSLYFHAILRKEALALEDFYLENRDLREEAYAWQLRAALQARMMDEVLQTWEAYRRLPYWQGAPASDPAWQALAGFIRQVVHAGPRGVPGFREALEAHIQRFAEELEARQMALRHVLVAPRDLSVAHLQQVMTPDERLLGLLPTEDTLYTLLIHPDTVLLAGHPVAEKDVTARLRFVLQLLRAPDHAPERLAPALHRLYVQTLAPFRAWIPPGSRLLVWAGLTWSVEALVTRRQPLRYLVESVDVGYMLTPGWWLEERRGSPPEVVESVVFVPRPRAYPGTDLEARSVAVPGLRKHLYRRRDASVKQLQQELARPVWVHVATHARQHPDVPLLGYVEMADGLFYVYEVFRMPVRSPVVVLSACETGWGRRAWTRQPEALLGFPLALVRNGARTVLTTRWPVDDRRTAGFMQAMYARIEEGYGLSQALAATQRTFRRQASTRHPYYWAAFCVLGGASYFTTGQSRKIR